MLTKEMIGFLAALLVGVVNSQTTAPTPPVNSTTDPSSETNGSSEVTSQQTSSFQPMSSNETSNQTATEQPIAPTTSKPAAVNAVIETLDELNCTSPTYDKCKYSAAARIDDKKTLCTSGPLFYDAYIRYRQVNGLIQCADQCKSATNWVKTTANQLKKDLGCGSAFLQGSVMLLVLTALIFFTL